MSSEAIPLDVRDLFETAHTDGDLSTKSLQSLTVDADIGAQIQGRSGYCLRRCARQRSGAGHHDARRLSLDPHRRQRPDGA